MDDSDEDVLRSGASSSKKRRLASSSSESNEAESNVTNDDRTRSSERIQHRRNRSFSMPARNDIWDEIPTTKTPEKKHDGLKPRKLVNNFTRVTHRYNHDPVYTSDEGSSLDGFIELEGELSTESSSSSDDYIPEVEEQFDGRKKKRKHRIKKHRIKQQSSDSESDPNKPKVKVTVPTDRGDDVRSLLRDKLLRALSADGGSSSNNKNRLQRETCSTEGNVVTAGASIRGTHCRPLLISTSESEEAASSRSINDRFKQRNRRKRQRKHVIRKEDHSDSNARSSEKTCDTQTLSSSMSSGKEHGSHSSEGAEDEHVLGDERVPTDGDNVIMQVQRTSVVTISSDTRCSDTDNSDTDNSDTGSDDSDTGSDDSDTGSDDSDTGSDDTALGRVRNQSKVQTEKRKSLFKDFMQARTKYESKTKSQS